MPNVIFTVKIQVHRRSLLAGRVRDYSHGSAFTHASFAIVGSIFYRRGCEGCDGIVGVNSCIEFCEFCDWRRENFRESIAAREALASASRLYIITATGYIYR